jgi:hypothetical protein
VFLFSYTNSYSCQSCKNFIPHSRGIPELGLCGIFKGNFAEHCRKDQNLCGEKGYLYEEEQVTNEKFNKDFVDLYDELNNRCSGEVNEKEELEQLEKDFAEMYTRIKKHNKNMKKPFFTHK